MTSLRIGLIGAGGIARAHLAAAQEVEAITLAAIAEPRTEVCQALATKIGAKPFGSAEDMLRHGSDLVDAVIVCTPPNMRVPIIRTALENSIAVLAEKPLAHTTEDAEKLAELSETYNHIPTAVGYCHRFTPAVVEMKRQLEAGELGEPVRFENVFASHFPAMAEGWMSDRAVSGGGSFLDTGCHSLDLCRFMTGGAQVVGAVYSHRWLGRGESSASVLCRAGKSGEVGAVICSGWAEPGRFTVEMVGTKASLHYDYGKPTELRRQPVEGPGETLSVESHDVRFTRQLRAFADFAGGGGRGVLCSFGEAAKVNRQAARSAEFAAEEMPPGRRIPVMATV